jgi:hypothetical protein
MLSLFYTVHKSLQDTIGFLSLLQSSLAVAWWRLPTAHFPLPLGSRIVLGFSYRFSQQQLTTTESQQFSNQLAPLHRLTDSSLGRLVEFLLAFASTVIPGFSLLEGHDQDFYSLLDMYVFRNGASSSTKEVSVCLCRRYVYCAVVSARVYPRCHGLQITTDSVHPLSLHWTE